MRFIDISSHFQAFYKKAILINFTKFIAEQSYKNLFFDKVLGLKFKKRLRTTTRRLFLLNTLYSLRRPQPQNVALDLSDSLMINYKHFQSKYCESLRVRINKIEFVNLTHSPTAQNLKCSIKDFFSKYDQIRRKQRIWPHLLKKSLMENLVFVQWPWNNGVAANKITATSSVE